MIKFNRKNPIFNIIEIFIINLIEINIIVSIINIKIFF